VTGVRHIPVAQPASRFVNSTTNLLAACEHPDVSGEFAYFNDDFFVLADLPDGIPALHRGPVVEVLAATGSSAYRQGAVATARLLRFLGVREPLSYELHIPMVIRKAGMISAIVAGRHLRVLHKRTLYGNLARVGGDRAPDCKITSLCGAIPDGAVFVSTSDHSFAEGLAGAQIRARFPGPCRYEKW
jgi:hypothetical protein